MLYLSLDKHLNAVWGLKLLSYSKKCLEFYFKLLISVFGERKVWLCSLSHKMFPYCNMVIVFSVSHCSYAIIQVSRPKMTWVLPNIAIKMQQRSCVLSVFRILFPVLSCTHLPWRNTELSRKQLHPSGDVGVNKNYPLAKKGMSLELEQCSQCSQAAEGNAPCIALV